MSEFNQYTRVYIENRERVIREIERDKFYITLLTLKLGYRNSHAKYDEEFEKLLDNAIETYKPKTEKGNADTAVINEQNKFIETVL